jgi:hypothetical protein
VDRRVGWHRVTLIVLHAVGVALRAWQYLGRDSFYMDEIAVLRNVVERGPLALVWTPLAYDQTAPTGFLLAEKAIVGAFGLGELSARLWPFASSVAALVVFARLAGRVLSPSPALAAIALMSTAGPLVLFAAEAKQYSSDVLATCALLLAAQGLSAGPDARSARGFAITGAIVGWFSQTSVFVLAATCACVGLEEVRTTTTVRAARAVGPAVAVAGLSGAASALVARHQLSAATDAYMHRFWASGFPPWPLDLRSAGEWLGRRTVEIFGAQPEAALLAYPAPVVCTLATLLGLLLLARSRSGRLVALPVVVTLAASIAGVYPFAQRLLLFLLPCVFLALGAVAEWIGGLLARPWGGSRVLAPALLAALGATPVLTAPPVYHLEDVRPVLGEVAARSIEGEKVYAYYGLGPALWFYRSLLPSSRELIAGGCHRGDVRAYLRELDQLRGASRAFVVLGHTRGEPGERQAILDYLSAIGTLRARLVPAGRLHAPTWSAVEAYEIDLSDPPKLRAASSTTFPLPSAAGQSSWRCHEGPIAMTDGDGDR